MWVHLLEKMPRKVVLLCAILAASPGCNPGSSHPILAILDEQTAEIHTMIAAVDRVQDKETALEELQAISDSFDRLIEIKKRMPRLYQKHARDKAPKSTLEAAAKEQVEYDAKLTAAWSRIENRDDLSLEFMSMSRKQGSRLIVTTLETLQALSRVPSTGVQFPANFDMKSIKRVIELYDIHGPQRVVELTVNHWDDRVSDLLVRASGSEAECFPVKNDEIVGVVAPVHDFDAFCSVLSEAGTVSERNDSRRELRFTLANTPAAANTAGAWEDGSPGQGSIPGHEDFQDEIEDHRRRAEEFHQRAMQRHQEFMDRARRLHDDPDASLGSAEEEFNEILDQTKRDFEDFRQPLRPVEPHEYDALARDLNDGDHSTRRLAARRLLTVEVDDVEDGELRRRIARGFRAMAFDSEADPELAVKGLVEWGGKYSASVLAEMLDRKPSTVPDALFEALTRYQDPRTIEPLVRQLSNPRNRDSAEEALQGFGPEAEAPLLETARSDDQEAILSAVRLLERCGTSQSYSALYDLSKHRDQEVQEAVRQTFMAIRGRER